MGGTTFGVAGVGVCPRGVLLVRGDAGGAQCEGILASPTEDEDEVDEEAVARSGDGGGFDLDVLPRVGIDDGGNEGPFRLPIDRSIPGVPGVRGVPGLLSISSRYANLSSSGTVSSFLSPSPVFSHKSCTSFRTSSFVFPQHPVHRHVRLSLASLFRGASPISKPPTCPLASPAMNARIAHSAVLIPQAGCQLSS